MKKVSRRQFLATSAVAAMYGYSGYALANNGKTRTEPSSSLPWSNWSGNVVGYPQGRISPNSDDELARYLKSTSGSIRPVGSGHSFAPLVPTTGNIIVADQFNGLIRHDSEKMTATFGAGTRLSDMGAALQQVGQAFFNLPDIDRQTLAGATATATHGTGINFQCLSGYITHVRLISPQGEQIDIDETSDPALFNAARVSLGALGVITQITLQNRSPYRLKQRSWVENTNDVLDNFDQHAASHRHFEILPLTHSDYSFVVSTDETDEPINNPPPSLEEEAAMGAAMRSWMEIPPEDRPPLINGLAEQIQPSEKIDESYKVLTNIRNNRFNEMEYAVPLEAGADCLREILNTIRDKKIDVVFPLEYRYVSRDDTLLSMSSGHEDHAAISVHRVASEDYRPYFDLIEPIFWKYGGRPHWGKIHTLGAPELAKLYPRFNDFKSIRKQLDPRGRMLNDHLRTLFGES
jgi:FAD-linked oxidoreductase|tara:strand:- start:164 stop:1552 length:1389 start_codon:yes stop_codon:yes gene_type:complete